MDRRTILFIISLTLSFMLVRTFFEPLPSETENSIEQKVDAQKEAVIKEVSEDVPQEFYVLENDYIQLVFSNIGGAVAEINLPFKTKENQKSAVLPIHVDKEILELSPKNAQFPLHPAKTATNSIQEPKLGGYYPLIRRDIIEAGPHNVSVDVPFRDYAFNIVSDFPEMARLNYEVTSFTDREITFQAKQPYRRITKTFTLPENSQELPYCFTVDIKIEGPTSGLWLTSGVPEIEWQSGASGAAIKYRITKGKSHEVLRADLPKDEITLSTVSPDWICNSNGFFGLILDPTKGQEAGFKIEKVDQAIDPTRLMIIDPEYRKYGESDTAGYNVLMPIKTAKGEMTIRLFAGPFSENILETVDKTFSEKKGVKDSDYIECQTYHGFFAFISEPFARFLFFFMKICHALTNSWTLSIVFATIVLRLILYPLNNWSMRSMKGMQEIGPEVKAIQERYKKDPQKAQMEIMQLYKSRGVNPVSGCLPLLLQLPFLIGMFDLLKTTYELRGTSFIPGWINDLTQPDVLFTWNFQIPFIGDSFHALPILLGVIMYIQQNMMSTLPKDPSQWTDQQRQSKAMGNIMPIVMTVLFYHFPSGLNIYWISSTLLGMLQQWWINKSMNGVVKKNTTIEVTPKKGRK